jgi:hypothetical protein
LAELEKAFRRHPGCAGLLESTSLRGVYGLLQDTFAKGPETQERLTKSAGEYRRLWRAGLAGSQEMADLLLDMLKWLQMVGLDPNTDPRMQKVLDSECWRLILSEVTPPECDTQLAELVKRIAGGARRVSAS